MKNNNVIIKNRQYIIYFLALGLVVVGYYGYNSEGISTFNKSQIGDIGDASLVSSNDILEDNSLKNINVTSNNNTDNNTISNNQNNNASVETSANVDYFASSKLDRNNMYSQMISSYQDMINSSGTTETQKEIATKEIEKINNTKNSIMICENLISTKGFKNSVVFVNDDSVSAVIEAEELKPEDLAQIQNILQRELKVQPDNLHISNKKAY